MGQHSLLIFPEQSNALFCFFNFFQSNELKESPIFWLEKGTTTTIPLLFFLLNVEEKKNEMQKTSMKM